MCGGFKFSKNALIALNILYIVSSVLSLSCYFWIVIFVCFLVGWFYLNWCSYIWKSCQFGYQLTYYWWHSSMWHISFGNCHNGFDWCCKTSSSSPFLCKFISFICFEFLPVNVDLFFSVYGGPFHPVCHSICHCLCLPCCKFRHTGKIVNICVFLINRTFPLSTENFGCSRLG